jgi:cell division protein FtsX
VSVYVEASASADQIRALGTELRGFAQVRTVYFEPADQAYAEFQRLYTCSADVSPTSIPASYRVVLHPIKRPERDALVTRIRALPGVTGVSCDPSSPCLGGP